MLMYNHAFVGLGSNCFFFHSITLLNFSPFIPFKLLGGLLSFQVTLCNNMGVSVKVLVFAQFAIIIDFLKTQQKNKTTMI